uniref:Anti-coagulant protein 5 n=4 Tax=Ancylostoma caninum TaxID=29170 RepID=Q16940_ANCCA|nr:anti-coagulant protein 5 precursor [Ancylostoma caninum]prf//2208501C anticoagulant protein:ISOTYPE=5 [Ancylostoma caninum]
MKMLYAIAIMFLLVSLCSARTVRKAYPECGENEWLDDCGTQKPCEAKCNEEPPEEEDPICRSRGCLLPPACVCKDGFYRDTVIGDCVREEECDQHEIIHV